ncbi:hypothetical protein PVAR5_7067 [Paecilomyces variotii No. 5]|uniref:Uncharacterized protein n=1 Tax=Byssochlamys spectabilis (strain No. 5 / NBRC 109023) TaxID=1356009 RepID=V5I4E3_BYSSN|nr:hypothetical protein PVAR5_7067 [Paecilomyces variotii No. 5]
MQCEVALPESARAKELKRDLGKLIRVTVELAHEGFPWPVTVQPPRLFLLMLVFLSAANNEISGYVPLQNFTRSFDFVLLSLPPWRTASQSRLNAPPQCRSAGTRGKLPSHEGRDGNRQPIEAGAAERGNAVFRRLLDASNEVDGRRTYLAQVDLVVGGWLEKGIG